MSDNRKDKLNKKTVPVSLTSTKSITHQGFVMSFSPSEEQLSEVVYTPSRTKKKDPAFKYKQRPPSFFGYEKDEESVICELRQKGFSVEIDECSDYYVSDGVGEGYKLWESHKPVFISAQTGRGKNTFIEDVLIPHVIDLNYQNNVDNKILIISNRIAANTQQKERIKGSRVAEVILYQGFFKFKSSNKLEKYKYIVCDECHFFTSDSSFNPSTSLILNEIIHNFHDSIRIYMSSTFTDVNGIIQNSKKGHQIQH